MITIIKIAVANRAHMGGNRSQQRNSCWPMGWALFERVTQLTLLTLTCGITGYHQRKELWSFSLSFAWYRGGKAGGKWAPHILFSADPYDPYALICYESSLGIEWPSQEHPWSKKEEAERRTGQKSWSILFSINEMAIAILLVFKGLFESSHFLFLANKWALRLKAAKVKFLCAFTKPNVCNRWWRASSFPKFLHKHQVKH